MYFQFKSKSITKEKERKKETNKPKVLSVLSENSSIQQCQRDQNCDV